MALRPQKLHRSMGRTHFVSCSAKLVRFQTYCILGNADLARPLPLDAALNFPALGNKVLLNAMDDFEKRVEVGRRDAPN